MKVLIVSHSHIGTYGAITSLKYLVRNIDWEMDLIYPKHYKENASDGELLSFFGGKLRNIYRAYLPYDNDVANERAKKSRLIKDVIINFAAFFDMKKVKRIIREEKYDYIILNSMILYPMIDQNARYVIYIREMFNQNLERKEKLINQLNRADKVIFIEPSLIVPLNGLKTQYRVITNPFDMSRMSELDKHSVQSSYADISKDKVVIMLAGVVADIKGVRFAIESFNMVRRDDLQLLIVGTGEQTYVEECMQYARDNPNVVFLGEQKNMLDIYLLSDYSLRADPFFAIGRTVYEGLFAGCGIVMQSDSDDNITRIDDYQMYEDRIYFYKIRDKQSLCDTLESLPKEKLKNRVFRSNVDQYIKQIKDFIR